LLVGRVHTTYVFKLTKSLDLDAIDARFPDTPQEIGAADLVQLFDRLVVKATSRNDSFAVVRHRLQSAGALAYVGEKEKAREVISSVKSSPWAQGHEKIIAAASRSPTYSPEGAILLDQER